MPPRKEGMIDIHIECPEWIEKEIRSLCTHRGDFSHIIREILANFVQSLQKQKAEVEKKKALEQNSPVEVVNAEKSSS